MVNHTRINSQWQDLGRILFIGITFLASQNASGAQTCASHCKELDATYDQASPGGQGPFATDESSTEVCNDEVSLWYHKDNCCGTTIIDKNNAKHTEVHKWTRTKEQSGK